MRAHSIPRARPPKHRVARRIAAQAPGRRLPRTAESNKRSLLQHFETYLQQHALSPATIRNYLADLRAFARWHGARKNSVAGFAPTDFGAYREHLCKETDHSPATVNRRLQSLRLFGRFLHETGQSAENPTRDIALVRNGNGDSAAPRTLAPGESVRLLEALRGARPSLAARDRAIVELMLHAGLRVHEVAALNVRDVLVTGRDARVEVCGTRESKARLVPLTTEAARALRDYLPTRAAIPRVERLFLSQRGQPLSVRSIQRLVDNYARAAQLADVCAQSLRHTCAKNWLAETRDADLVAQWLGQRDPRTLEKYLR